MTEYTYNNGILRIKSDEPIGPRQTATIRREDTEKIVTTVYRLGLRVKKAQSGGFFYEWFSAKPETVTVDNSPKLLAALDERCTENQLAIAELAEALMEGGEM